MGTAKAIDMRPRKNDLRAGSRSVINQPSATPAIHVPVLVIPG